MLKNNSKNLILTLFAISFFIPGFANAASLSLSPANGTYNIGDILTVNVTLDSYGQPVDGVDLRYLNYNPFLFELIDEDSNIAGVQIIPGILMPSTVANIADAANGKISFSQITSGNTTFSGNGILATMRLKAKAIGSADLLFDFAPGNTADTNVASGGDDILTSVSGGTYQINNMQTPPPSEYMLYLSPSEDSFNTGDTFSVYVILNTKGQPVDGADIVLSYNQSMLDVVDKDSGKDGAQILAGTLMPNTPRNEVKYGNIYFSQTTSSGNLFTGSGVLAAIDFKAKATGTAKVNFSFSAGKTSDSNVSSGGADILDSVLGGTYIISSNNLPPVIYNASPFGTASIVPGDKVKIDFKTNEGASCKYSTTPYTSYESMKGVFSSSDKLNHYAYIYSTGYSIGYNIFYVRCQDTSGQKNTSDSAISFNIVYDTASPLITNSSPVGTFFMPKNIHISVSPADSNGVSTCKYSSVPNISYDSMKSYLYKRNTSASNGDYVYSTLIYARDLDVGQNTFYVKCKDRAGNVNNTDAVISFTLLAPPSFKISLEGVPASSMSSTQIPISLFYPGRTESAYFFKSYLDKNNMIIFSVDNTKSNNLIGPGYYDILASPEKYIGKRLNSILLDSGSVTTFPTLRAGDLNMDGAVNSLDWSFMSEKWGGSSSSADINRDYSINSVDWGYLRKNWLLQSDH